MRRKDRELTDPAAIEHILSTARIVHLGLVDGNAPYVVPMHYGYALEGGRLTLYLHSAPEGRKLDVLRANPNAFIEIDTGEALISGGDDACRYGAAFESIMGSGRAVLVEDAAEKARGLALLMRTQTGRDFPITEAMTRGVAVIRVDVEWFTAKRRDMPI